MASIEQRITALENRRNPDALQEANIRPQISKGEWLEIQQREGFGAAEHPHLLAEILARRGDGSEIQHSDYIRKLEKQYGNN